LLAQIPSGTTLYHLLAVPEPNASAIYIGDIIMTSQFTTSYWGDKYMFFKHENMQDDLNYRPDWTADVPVTICPWLSVKDKIAKVFS